MFQKLSAQNPALAAEGNKLKSYARYIGIDITEYTLNLRFGGSRGDFGFLEYHGGPVNEKRFFADYQKAFAHYGVAAATTNGVQYRYVTLPESHTEPVPAYTVIAGGLVEGGKSDIEALLNPPRKTHQSRYREKAFHRLSPLTDWEAEVFSLRFDDREAIRSAMFRELAVRNRDLKVFRYSENVTGWGTSEYWGTGYRAVERFRLSDKDAAKTIRRYVDKNRRRIRARKAKRIAARLFPNSEGAADRLLKSAFPRITFSGNVVTVEFRLAP
jgi:hypothetical protein